MARRLDQLPGEMIQLIGEGIQGRSQDRYGSILAFFHTSRILRSFILRLQYQEIHLCRCIDGSLSRTRSYMIWRHTLRSDHTHSRSMRWLFLFTIGDARLYQGFTSADKVHPSKMSQNGCRGHYAHAQGYYGSCPPPSV
jgi:hypothetical protein